MSNFLKSNFITDKLAQIKESLIRDEFIDVENEKFELKDLSNSGDFKSLKETICAFLNTDGGIVLCGIRERHKKYILNGFDRNSESRIIELQKSVFLNLEGQTPDLSQFIIFEYLPFEIKDVVKDLLLIAVYPLPDDQKYVSISGTFYERRLTQDKKIETSKILKQKEYKRELEYAREIQPIVDAKISDLSLDKLNNYIGLLNKEIRSETLKANFAKARPFLINQHFLREEQVTMLGMLVCGSDPFHFLSSRVEVNAYYNTSQDISSDKKIFRSDVISLMEETFRYIWGNIKVNRSVSSGGTSQPEYPETLIRETINNALAHRDYSIDNFITVRVEPAQFIEIKNPGSFKEKIKITESSSDVVIRRLIPGIPESKNPKLASVLKVFDKIESQGRGMASLVNAALENKIDLPYYEIKENIIGLRIPTGKLIDESIETWLNGFKNYIEIRIKNQLTDDHKAVLAYFFKSELLNNRRFYTILLSESNNHFQAIDELKNGGLLMEHESSTEQTPIYILDRVLLKTDFRQELIETIGEEFIHFDVSAKEILNLTYLYTKYNKQALKAAEITPEVYRRIHGNIVVAKTYESLGRKIRGLCNNFVGIGLLLKKEKNSYLFNFDFVKSQSLF
jgi:predicted HTH transcriptional regulator